MKTTIPIGGGILRCDAPNCPEQFVSYSISLYLRPQAIRAGWGRMPGILVDKPGELKKDIYDLCPKHLGLAKIVKAERDAARAEKKKQKVEEQVKKDTAKRERAERAQAKREEKERRRQAREQARAERERIKQLARNAVASGGVPF